MRLREVRQPTQSEALDKTAFEPSSSLTSKPVPFLPFCPYLHCCVLGRFLPFLALRSSLPLCSNACLFIRISSYVAENLTNLWSAREKIFVERMTFLLLFAFFMFHAFSSPHLSIMGVCYQQLRWDLNQAAVNSEMRPLLPEEHGVIPRWSRFNREERHG